MGGASEPNISIFLEDRICFLLMWGCQNVNNNDYFEKETKIILYNNNFELIAGFIGAPSTWRPGQFAPLSYAPVDVQSLSVRYPVRWMYN